MRGKEFWKSCLVTSARRNEEGNIDDNNNCLRLHRVASLRFDAGDSNPMSDALRKTYGRRKELGRV
jgi:hypothetical protein